MPPKFIRAPTINPAVAALGVGIQPDRWEITKVIDAMTTRYLQLIQQGEEARQREQKVRIRALAAGAYELASLIAEYYQSTNRTEDFVRWSKRRDRAYAAAYTRASIIQPATEETDVPPGSPVPRP